MTTPDTKSVPIVFRDKEQFYRIIHWLNTNIGQGRDYWRMNTGILKKLGQGEKPSATIRIFNSEFDSSELLFELLK